MPNRVNSANRRLISRTLTLLVVGLVATYIQRGYEKDGDVWLLIMELLLYAVCLVVFLSGQTGRLKSGLDNERVTSVELFEEDSSVRTYIVIYLFLLMIAVVTHAIRGNEIELEPWNMFVSMAPVFLIVFVRQHRLERHREPR